MSASPTPASSTRAADRGFWLRTLHQWHWISSAVCLIGMLLFSITGITLNHASQIEASPQLTQRQLQLPAAQLDRLRAVDTDKAPLPAATAAWLGRELDISIGRRQAEYSPGEVYLSMPGPGRDAWIAINTDDGQVEFEQTRRGAVSYLNDLHKGRNTGPAWGWFLDVFAVACLVFCITGLFLLHLHARQRAMTWPLVGLGLVIPALIALLLIH